MSDRKLAILGIVAVLMAGWAILQNRISQNTNTTDFSSSPLIEGLQIEAVSAITITSEKGAQTTTLNRAGGGFVVAEKDDYPADITKINSLINNCLDIRTHEKVTDSQDNHADLGVTEETARYRIAFLNSEGGEIVGFFVSKSNEDGIAFTRLEGRNEVYSIQQPPFISTKPMDYVDSELCKVSKNQISSVTVKTGKDSYVLTASGDKSDIVLQAMPAGKQFKGTAYRSVFGTLSSLRFEDVMKVASAPGDLNFDSTYTCQLDDKTIYTLLLAKAGEKTYAKVSADYPDKTPVQKTVGQVESEEELKAKEAKLLATDAVKAFNEKHQGWVYQIPSYKAGDLTKPLSELVEDAPKPEEPAESADPNKA
jgi:hypothetical protein